MFSLVATIVGAPRWPNGRMQVFVTFELVSFLKGVCLIFTYSQYSHKLWTVGMTSWSRNLRDSLKVYKRNRARSPSKHTQHVLEYIKYL